MEGALERYLLGKQQAAKPLETVGAPRWKARWKTRNTATQPRATAYCIATALDSHGHVARLARVAGGGECDDKDHCEPPCKSLRASITPGAYGLLRECKRQVIEIIRTESQHLAFV